MTKQVRVGIAGLGFGAEFIPIYQAHPDADLVAVSQLPVHETMSHHNRSHPGADQVAVSQLDLIADQYGVPGRYNSIEEMIEDPDIDAVHINTPIPDHAAHSIAALKAGKHVACTVPMATSLEDIQAIVAAVDESGLNYMMMETAVYTREFLHVKELYDTGELGRVQFMRGAHYQDMTGWPWYWAGLPPMHYGTHAVSPILALLGKRAESVMCVGSGRIDPALAAKYGSPFAVESALINLVDCDVKAEVARSLFETAMEYVESFDVLASKASFRWSATHKSDHQLHVANVPQGLVPPDYAHRLPAEIRKFATRSVYDGETQHLSYVQGSGHGGSHPHLAHEFVSSIIENRPAAIDQRIAANWTLTGITAHQSALQGGQLLPIPSI